mgnify:CR=1 FL=1
MIAFLHGVVASKGPDFVVLDVGGIGFLLKTSTPTSDAVGMPGTTTRVHTCLLVRDENPVLYGFASEEERSFFLSLISVTGIGPRVALSLLSSLKPDDLAGAIVRNDTALLSHVPGVGKKLAARLCVELQNKVESFVATTAPPAAEGESELIAALMALGYSMREASEGARRAAGDSTGSLEVRLKVALKALTRG